MNSENRLASRSESDDSGDFVGVMHRYSYCGLHKYQGIFDRGKAVEKLVSFKQASPASRLVLLVHPVLPVRLRLLIIHLAAIPATISASETCCAWQIQWHFEHLNDADSKFMVCKKINY